MIKPWKYLLLAGCIALQGCVASSYVQDNLMADQYEYSKKIDEDQMIAIGQLKNANPSSEMLFIGQKYSYVISRGGEQLLNMIQQLPAEQRILTSEVPIKFRFNDETNFFGMLKFRYATPVKNLTTEQITQLKALGFNQQLSLKDKNGESSVYLNAAIGFSGKLHEAVSTDQIQYKMSQPYPIVMSKTVSKKVEKSTAKNVAGLLLMPLAIGVDIVTFPVAVGIVGYELTHKDAFK